MKWTFKCPNCNNWGRIDWNVHGAKCSLCNTDILIPTPKEQPAAYVDQHDWPQAMEDAVVAIYGKQCVIAGCTNTDFTLDHIVAYSKQGKTSVNNLQPMCGEHNSSKGDSSEAIWLRENGLSKRL